MHGETLKKKYFTTFKCFFFPEKHIMGAAYFFPSTP
jgi:hypothetical protein